MSDFASILEVNNEWNEFKNALKKGVSPSAVAMVLPEVFHEDMVLAVARLWLCENSSCCGNCPSCLGWVGDEHPDLVRVSTDGKAPSVEQCRSVIEELSLKPVIAPGRLAVIPSADMLNLNAANSLLKVTEEPPEGAHILYLMKENNLIPTLRSRMWCIPFSIANDVPSVDLPGSPDDWMRLFKGKGKKEKDLFFLELNGIVRNLEESEQFEKAATLSQIIWLAKKTHLSPSMVGDLIFLSIEEDYPFERFFDDLW